MDANKVLAERFLKLIDDNYAHLKNKMRKFCDEKDYEFDEDVFSDTYLKVYDKILRDGLKDESEQGMMNYFFIAFKMNLKRSKQYKSVSSRDFNVTDEELNELYEEWTNEHKDSSKVKLVSDLWKDFATLYIMEKVNEHFPPEKSQMFKIKYLVKGMTYKKLAESHPEIEGHRNKVLEVRDWVRQNISKDEINEEFYRRYDDLL